MHFGKHKRIVAKAAMTLGVILWVGALSPEIFVDSGKGCIMDENGNELTAEEAEDFMERYFYGDMDEQVEIKYRLALTKFF